MCPRPKQAAAEIPTYQAKPNKTKAGLKLGKLPLKQGINASQNKHGTMLFMGPHFTLAEVDMQELWELRCRAISPLSNQILLLQEEPGDSFSSDPQVTRTAGDTVIAIAYSGTGLYGVPSSGSS